MLLGSIDKCALSEQLQLLCFYLTYFCHVIIRQGAVVIIPTGIPLLFLQKLF